MPQIFDGLFVDSFFGTSDQLVQGKPVSGSSPTWIDYKDSFKNGWERMDQVGNLPYIHISLNTLSSQLHKIL